jgi:bifunctional non-homologous end joining protein LigD
LGAYDSSGELRYVGRVGTGFSERTVKELRERLDRLKQTKSPFAEPLPADDRRGAQWVCPELVAQVQFTEWTRDKKIRLPSFQGLRPDKPAQEIVLAQVENAKHEKPSVVPEPTSPGKKKSDIIIAGVRLTEPDKVLYSDSGYTKQDLALYYQAVSEHILPHLRARALTLVRCPYGLSRCFYQKSVHEEIPAVLDRAEFNERTTGDRVTYLVANKLSPLIALVEIDVLELHTWGSSTDDLESPDRITWDLDPAEELGWEQVVEAAVALKALLSQLKLQAFVKTTGGKGLHVVVPIAPEYGWDHVKGFAQAVANILARTFPNRFTTTMAKEKRSGKIFVDYLRNVAGATAVAAYSPRAKPNAPVSVPISWKELEDGDLRFDHFNIRNVP